MRIAMTLLVRDEADIVDHQIAYHLAAGVDVVIATDHRSVDGTTEILEKYEAQGRLHLIREKSEHIQQGLWVTRMARLAATEYEVDWVVHSDADEFWWPRHGTLRETFERVPRHVGVVRGRVQNFVPRPGGGMFAERMTARLSGAVQINDAATPYRPAAQVAHRGGPNVVVAQGNHAVEHLPFAELRSWLPFELLHFPFRTRQQVSRKHANTVAAWKHNLRGDLARARMLLEDGRSELFWERVVVDDAELARGLAGDCLIVDTRLRDALREICQGRFQVQRPSGPSLADAVAYAGELQALSEADLVRANRWVDQVGLRILALEEPAPRRR